MSSLSISSVGPAFSIAAAGGVMIGYSGSFSLVAILLIALPSVLNSLIFRLLNQHFPQSGASYYWSARVLGETTSRFQGWVIILAYFTSLPPIVLPAAQYTIALIHPQWATNIWVQFIIGTFWILFAAIPLLFGAHLTARITQIFMIVEFVFLLVFATLGIGMLPYAHFSVSTGSVPISGILLTMVIATTILDGWEIDSYATEESIHPRKDPGIGGIIGAFSALGIYMLFFPLILTETPIHLLENSPDVMLAWSQKVSTHFSISNTKWILVPILASTVGSLWLTGYILIRSLFVMGRDRLIPYRFAKLNRHGVPSYATLVILLTVWLVTLLQLFISSFASFFNVILSTAGFFLTLEFMLDSLTATIFLWQKHDENRAHTLKPHSHFWMRIGSLFTTVYLSAVIVGFLILSPKIISPWIDRVILVLILFGFVFVIFPRKVRPTIHIFEFEEIDVSLAKTSHLPGE
ncbi:APC family permease [Fodinisporobacter ferrooxydans]|uniref:APC family permease n=1 Tax=Fodinisporobacter ferrooxydans TaxID=2901836 RepID=A0ABY4CR05_9BACL|nr:APC family permease [Alicyclobacillaceae bacterium MYW30-H2]